MARGRPEKRKDIAAVRDLTSADIARLEAGERGATPVVQTLRDSHHMVAKLIASGMRLQDVAVATGYSITRIYTLNQGPAFKELVESYRTPENKAYAEHRDSFYELMYSNKIKAERQLGDHLDKADEENELLSVRELISISRDAADRTGYGKRTMNVNLNGADFAASLDRAMRRSAKIIEGTLQPLPAPRSRRI